MGDSRIGSIALRCDVWSRGSGEMSASSMTLCKRVVMSQFGVGLGGRGIMNHHRAVGILGSSRTQIQPQPTTANASARPCCCRPARPPSQEPKSKTSSSRPAAQAKTEPATKQLAATQAAKKQ